MSDKKTSLLEKLRHARVDFQAAGIKKTGYNKFVGFDYYELSDILPKINELSSQYGFICMVSFDTSLATLKVIDTDDPVQVVSFTSPMAACNLKGAHEIQNMGAVQTYMRRYLYMMAFEIVENDTFDGEMGKKNDKTTPPPSTPKPSPSKPQNEETEIDALGKALRIIVETKSLDHTPYFTDKEVETEKTAYSRGTLQSIRAQHDRLKKELEKRIAEYQKIPFEPEFKDDIPYEQNNEEIQIF